MKTLSNLTNRLINNLYLLGDQAFQNCKGVVCPYTQHDQSATGHDKSIFNKIHSQDRMSSEHTIGYLKQWGIARGRSDIRLFESNELYIESIHCVWAIHNYVNLNCPNF